MPILNASFDEVAIHMLDTVNTLVSNTTVHESDILDANDAPIVINNTSVASRAHPTDHIS